MTKLEEKRISFADLLEDRRSLTEYYEDQERRWKCFNDPEWLAAREKRVLDAHVAERAQRRPADSDRMARVRVAMVRQEAECDPEPLMDFDDSMDSPSGWERFLMYAPDHELVDYLEKQYGPPGDARRLSDDPDEQYPAPQ